MLVSLAMKAERGSMDWPRTQDMESRNHWDSSCHDSSSGGGHELPAMELPSAKQVIKQLEEHGKAEGINEIMEIVNDKEQMSVEEIEEAEAKAAESEKKKVFVAEFDDDDDSEGEKPHHMVGFNEVPTELREVVILSPQHGLCSKNAWEYSRFDKDDVVCKLIENPKDCETGKKLLGGRSDVFNDMTPEEGDDLQEFASAFQKRHMKMYPPGCIGRIPGTLAPMHISFNPLLPPENKERAAKANKGASVKNRLICGCYDKV